MFNYFIDVKYSVKKNILARVSDYEKFHIRIGRKIKLKRVFFGLINKKTIKNYQEIRFFTFSIH